MPTKPALDEFGAVWLACEIDLELVFTPQFTVPPLTGRRTVMTLERALRDADLSGQRVARGLERTAQFNRPDHARRTLNNSPARVKGGSAA